MIEYTIDEKLRAEEIQVQSNISSLIDNGMSFYFLAGAGAGKTYALVESLKYYLNKKQNELEKTGRKLACITYTNAAKGEVIERLYENDNITVSTIHSFLWGIIEHHQRELLDIHIEYLREVISDTESSLYTDDKNSKKSGYKKFRSLEHEEKKSLLMVIESQDESLYKLFKIKTAKDFWADLSSLINEDIFRKLQGNRTEIEKILRDLLKIKKLRYCIKKIEEGDIKYQKINYKEIGGREVLHRNRIGHDTLILYSHRIVNKYDILKKIILDSYPAVFIDEYQDTHSQVISLFDELLSYSKKNKLSFTLSLFGDPVQSIYSNNLNNREIKNKIEIVEKNINRRSHKQIIDCISKIRGLHQEINQVSIYSDKKDGTVSYYIANKSEVEPKIVIDNKISEYKDKWGISSKNKLSCMVLKNKNLSELCNFEDYYSIIEKTYQDKTSLVRFDSVNEELLSKDLTRLGSLPIAILNIVKPLYFLTHCRQRPLTDIFSSESLESNSLENVIACLDDLRESKYQNIKSYVEDIIIKSNKESDLYSLYKNLNIYNVDSWDEFSSKLCLEISDAPSKDLELHMENLVSLDLEQIFNWITFILDDNESSDIHYLTCHSSKGLEFENVIVFLEDKFGKNSEGKIVKDKFTSFFKQDINTPLGIDLESTRNLLYVICSRAIKNLCVVLFTDDSSKTDTSLDIFNNVFEIDK